MTLVHISLKTGRAPQLGGQIGQRVHRAITEVLDVAAANRFQIVTEQGAELINDAPLENERANAAVIVLIYLTGRYSDRKKRALFGRIGAMLDSELGIASRDVVVGVIDAPAQNWTFGYDETQFRQMLAYQLP